MKITANDLPLTGQITRRGNLAGPDYAGEEAEEADLDQANLITSEIRDLGLHKVVLDIDMPVKVVDSSTPGHHHLFIDKELTWEQYSRLIWVLADIGIVEEGYASASHARGYTAVRLPWVRK